LNCRPRAAHRPRAICEGAIDDRAKKALVEITVRAVGSLVMVGLRPDKSVSQWLRSIDKVYIFAGVSQMELAATVEACSLRIFPHRDQTGIRAMSPLKLYGYVVGGLPVLAVDHPPMHEWPITEYASVIPNMGRWVESPRESARFGRRETAIRPRDRRGMASVTGDRRGRPRPSDRRGSTNPQFANRTLTQLS
jgi:hypothetical protein